MQESEAAFADVVKAAMRTTGGAASRSSILRDAATSFRACWRASIAEGPRAGRVARMPSRSLPVKPWGDATLT